MTLSIVLGATALDPVLALALDYGQRHRNRNWRRPGWSVASLRELPSMVLPLMILRDLGLGADWEPGRTPDQWWPRRLAKHLCPRTQSSFLTVAAAARLPTRYP
jgi:hypothetical protein